MKIPYLSHFPSSFWFCFCSYLLLVDAVGWLLSHLFLHLSTDFLEVGVFPHSHGSEVKLAHQGFDNRFSFNGSLGMICNPMTHEDRKFESMFLSKVSLLWKTLGRVSFFPFSGHCVWMWYLPPLQPFCCQLECCHHQGHQTCEMEQTWVPHVVKMLSKSGLKSSLLNLRCNENIFFLVKQGFELEAFCPGLALSCNPPTYTFPCSRDYRNEPAHSDCLLRWGSASFVSRWPRTMRFLITAS